MTCSTFLARFSEFHDGGLGPDEAESFREHIRTCRSCERYERVVRRGGEVLRENPGAVLPSGFRDRLQHSILLLDEERRRRRVPGTGSGLTTFALVAAVAAAMLIAPAFWGGEPGVELPGIVVMEPPPLRTGTDAAFSLVTGSSVAPVGSSRSSLPASFDELELWSQSNTLLFRYSSLYSKRREPTVVRAGLR
ncbi:MAG: zf-HC2 domain-containing protein [Gemmatimonadota bacterium]